MNWYGCFDASRYYISYRNASSPYWTSVGVGNVTSTQITNLLPSTTYYFRVQCANGIGIGQYGASMTVTTPNDEGYLACITHTSVHFVCNKCVYGCMHVGVKIHAHPCTTCMHAVRALLSYIYTDKSLSTLSVPAQPCVYCIISMTVCVSWSICYISIRVSRRVQTKFFIYTYILD